MLMIFMPMCRTTFYTAVLSVVMVVAFITDVAYGQAEISPKATPKVQQFLDNFSLTILNERGTTYIDTNSAQVPNLTTDLNKPLEVRIDELQKAADKIVLVAQVEHDDVGEALVYRKLAWELPSDHTHSVTAAWNKAADAWRRVGDGPGRMEAYCEMAIHSEAMDDASRLKLLIALGIGRLETKRPLAAARVLNYYAMVLHKPKSFYDRMMITPTGIGKDLENEIEVPSLNLSRENISWCYLTGAASILRKNAPNSPEMIAVFHNLGRVEYDAGHFEKARIYFEAARAAIKPSQSASEAAASVLFNLSLVAFKEGKIAKQQLLYQQAATVLSKVLPNAPPGGGSVTNINQYSVPEFVLFQDTLTLAKSVGEDNAMRYAQVTGVPGMGTNMYWETKPDLHSPDFIEAISSDKQSPNHLDARVVLITGRETFEYIDAALHKQVPSVRNPSHYQSLINQVRNIDQAPLPSKIIDMKSVLRELLESKHTLTNVSPVPNLELGYIKQIHDSFVQSFPMAGGDITGDFSRGIMRSETGRLIADALKHQQVVKAWHMVEQDHAAWYQGQWLEASLFTGSLGVNLTPREHDSLISIYSLVEKMFHVQGKISSTASFLLMQLNLLNGPNFENQVEPSDALGSKLETAVQNAVALSQELDSILEQDTDSDARTDIIKNAAQKVRPAVPTFSEIDRATKSIPADSIYISFSVGDTEVDTFLFKAGKPIFSHVISCSPNKLFTQVQNLHELASNPDSKIDDLTKEGSQLFETLFSPQMRAEIRATKRIIIAPEGYFWNLPFAVLVAAPGPEIHYLGREKAISCVQTLLSFDNRPAEPLQANEVRALVVGNPDCEHNPIGTVSILSENSALASIPNTAAEATTVAHLYHTQPLLGNDASEMMVRAHIEQADVIHLATHGYAIANPFFAMSSSILLTAPRQVTSSANDGLLEAWEVLTQLNLNARLVVLSACETGLGPRDYGDGFGRMIRSFQVAGAQSVVASQWEVDDLSTRQLMASFHINLIHGLPKDIALQQAICAEAKKPDFSHPFYWAPFFLVGSTNPVVKN